jgi:hypothetical protein
VNERVGKEGRNDGQRNMCLLIFNLREAAVVCLNYAQPIDVNYTQTIPYPKGTPRGCGDVWLCIATHCGSDKHAGMDAWWTLEGLGDGLTRNLDCDPRVWEGRETQKVVRQFVDELPRPWPSRMPAFVTHCYLETYARGVS